MQAQDVLTTNVITATSETTLEEATAPMVASHASAMARLDPAYINVVVEGSRVDVWDLAGLDAEENAETTSRDTCACQSRWVTLPRKPPQYRSGR